MSKKPFTTALTSIAIESVVKGYTRSISDFLC